MDNSLAHRQVPQGRRPSVERTTTRRRPSARRRLGAGYLPAWLLAAGVAGSPERFRVVAESEFFGGPELEWTSSGRPLRIAGWTRRAVVAAMLAASVGVFGGVVAANLAPASSHSRRRSEVDRIVQARPILNASPNARDVASVAPRVPVEAWTSDTARSASAKTPARVRRVSSRTASSKREPELDSGSRPRPESTHRSRSASTHAAVDAAVVVAAPAPVARAVEHLSPVSQHTTAGSQGTRVEFGFER